MNKFKDVMGRWITSGLFKETAQKKDYIIFTLAEARSLYIEANDLTGYLFATTVLGGWKHWLALKESPALLPHILQWEDELEVKVRSLGLQNIMTASKGIQGYQASKYLVEGGWNKKTVGRPSKAQVQKESKIRAAMYDEFKMEVVK